MGSGSGSRSMDKEVLGETERVVDGEVLSSVVTEMGAGLRAGQM